MLRPCSNSESLVVVLPSNPTVDEEPDMPLLSEDSRVAQFISPKVPSPERALLCAVLERAMRDLVMPIESPEWLEKLNAFIWFVDHYDAPVTFKFVLEELELSSVQTNFIMARVEEARQDLIIWMSKIDQSEPKRKAGRESNSRVAKRKWRYLCSQKPAVCGIHWNQ